MHLTLMEHFKKQGHTYKYLKEYAFGVEVSPDERVSLDGKEHSEFKWVSLQEAIKLLKWKENKEALKKLNRILSMQK